MKKLSLAAILALSAASLLHADITLDSVSGDAKLFYDTTDQETVEVPNADLFNKASSIGDASVSLDLKATVNKSVKINTGITAVTTLGLEHTLVGATFVNHTDLNTSGEYQAGLNDAVFFDEANIAFTTPLGGTMVVGRQYLDTPLVFSETWNVAANSYDAAVCVHKVSDLTIVAAWVGRSNVAGAATVNTGATLGGQFDRFTSGAGNQAGAYAAGLVYSANDVTVQAWDYEVPAVANAIWLQADAKVANIDLGVQYSTFALDADGAEDPDMFAVKAGTTFGEASVSLAYSSVSKGDHNFANVGGVQSKIYTEAWWNYGYVTDNEKDDVSAISLTAEYGAFGAYITSIDTGSVNNDVFETALTYAVDFGNLATSFAYVYEDFDANKDSDNRLQVYLTYSF